MKNKKIAVIIINYGSSHDTFLCINSVLNEIKNCKVYLIDNFYDENEAKTINKHYKENYFVTTILLNKNMGFSHAVNIGIKAAILDDIELYLILNNDAAIVQGNGRLLTDFMEKNPYSLITPTIDWNGDIVNKKYYHRYFSLLKDSHPTDIWTHYLTGCSLAFDKAVIDNIGFFDKRFFMYGEDIEFSHRAQSFNIPLKVIPDIVIIHEGSKSSKLASLFYEYHINRGHILLVSSLSNNVLEKIFMYIFRLFLLSLKGLIRSFRFKSFSPLAGSLLAWLPLKIRPKAH